MCASAIGCDKESKMSSEAMIMLAISVLTAVYLVYALLRPEKF